MSAATTVNRRYVIGAALGLLIALLVGLGALQWTELGGGGAGGAAERPPAGPLGSVAAPRIQQARWEVRARPVGTLSKPSRKAKQRFLAQRKPLGGTVRDIYNSMFLLPSSAADVIERSFTKSAAAAFDRLRVGLPRGAEDVAIKTRTASLAIDMAGADRATARVRLVAKATVRENRILFKHVAALFLTRQSRTWKVIAFDVDQGPFERDHHKARRHRKPDNDKKKEGGRREDRGTKRSKKGRNR